MNSDWKVRLIERPGWYGYQVYVARNVGDGTREYVTDGGSIIRTVKRGEALDDEKLQFAVLEHDQLKAIVDAFSDLGLKSKNDHKIEGLLDATKYHLEDMRTIALKGFKNGK